MFEGAIVWRGVVYAILMVFAKCATGVWLVILPTSTKFVRKTIVPKSAAKGRSKGFGIKKRKGQESVPESRTSLNTMELSTLNINDSLIKDPTAKTTLPQSPKTESPETEEITPNPPPPRKISKSLHKNFYPALLLGLAMTTRGEIGFLIAAIAQTANVGGPTEVYLVVLWAILLCTLLGPIGVGVITRRIKKMAEIAGGRAEILGGWGEAVEQDGPRGNASSL